MVATRRQRYDLFISAIVVEEAELGDAAAAAARLAVLRDLPLASPSPEADTLAETLMRDTPLPLKAAADAAHIAAATTGLRRGGGDE